MLKIMTVLGMISLNAGQSVLMAEEMTIHRDVVELEKDDKPHESPKFKERYVVINEAGRYLLVDDGRIIQSPLQEPILPDPFAVSRDVFEPFPQMSIFYK